MLFLQSGPQYNQRIQVKFYGSIKVLVKYVSLLLVTIPASFKENELPANKSNLGRPR